MTITDADLKPTASQRAAAEETKKGTEKGPVLASQAIISSNSNQMLTNTKNENILRAVLSLCKDLNETGLETIKRDIDRKLAAHNKRTAQSGKR